MARAIAQLSQHLSSSIAVAAVPAHFRVAYAHFCFENEDAVCKSRAPS